MQADLDAGSITNTATATTTYGVTLVTSPVASKTINAVQSPSLTLTKGTNSATYDHAGQVIIYTFTIQNTGNVTLPGPFSVSDSNLGAISPCGSGPVAPTATISCTVNYTIVQADLDAGSITNTATATTTFGQTPVTSLPVSKTINAVQTPAIGLTKGTNSATYDHVGQIITYTFTVQNTGNVTLAGPFAVSDNRLGAISPCGSGPLAPTATTSCTANYTIVQADLDAGSITNTATATTTYGVTPVTSLPASKTINAVQSPALALTKGTNSATYDHVGQVITYTFTIQNTGNVTLAGPFSVSDSKLGAISSCGSGPLAPTATTSCTANYTIVQADLDAGSVTNTATASGNGVTSPVASKTINAVQTPAILLTKGTNSATYDHAGQVIIYTFTIQNTGNVTLAGPFSVSDSKLGTISSCGSWTAGANRHDQLHRELQHRAG